MKGAILKDDRKNQPSTHVCVFLNKSNEIIAMPIALNENNIHLFTIKDVKAEWENPSWFISNYNKIASSRGMNHLSKSIKITTEQGQK